MNKPQKKTVKAWAVLRYEKRSWTLGECSEIFSMKGDAMAWVAAKPDDDEKIIPVLITYEVPKKTRHE